MSVKGSKLSAEHKRKISKAFSERGFVEEEERKEKIRQASLARRDEISEQMTGNTHAKGNKSHRGRKLSEEHRRNLSEVSKGKPKSKAHRLALSKAHKGVKLSEAHKAGMRAAWTPEKREEVGKKHKWENLSDSAKTNILRARKHLASHKQNYAEKHLERILHGLGFPFKFVGDLKYWIGGKCPDFVWEEENKIIELFGNHWHKEEEVEKRINLFKEEGFDTLVIWYTDLKKKEDRVINDILSFAGGIQ